MSTARVVTDESFEAEVLNGPRPVIVEYGGEVVRQVIGARWKSALLREFSDFI